MLTEKDMALDALECAKHTVSELTKAAMEASNPSLKNTFVQMRNRCEQSQQEIAQLTISKGWYMPAVPADPSDIRRVSSFFNQPMQQMPMQHTPQYHQYNPMRFQ